LNQLVLESNQVAQNMTDVIWAMDEEETEWKYLVEKMEEYLYSLNLTRIKPSIIFRTDGLTESYRLPLNVRHHLLMIFKEAINNIQKHTVSSLIKVELNNKADAFKMNIRNEFSQRVSNSHSTGRGLLNIKRRIEELKGEVTIIKEKDVFDLTIQIPKIN